MVSVITDLQNAFRQQIATSDQFSRMFSRTSLLLHSKQNVPWDNRHSNLNPPSQLPAIIMAVQGMAICKKKHRSITCEPIKVHIHIELGAILAFGNHSHKAYADATYLCGTDAMKS